MVRQAHHERLKLTALAVGLVGTETARALQPSFHRWIRDGEDLASIEIDIVEREDMDIYLPLSKDDQISESQLKIELKKSGREIKLQVVGEIPHPQEFWNDTPFANISPE